MLKIKNLTMKNFMSVGNVTQSINFNETDLVLVLGENLDLGGNDNRNGVGKSSIINALSYALYGTSLTSIRKDNLINATNLKNMLVTLAFEINGVEYRIERGRRPGVFRLIKNDDEVENDGVESDESESQGENRHTQEEIERLIGMSHDMFKHIVALNTYVTPFLSMKSGEQRTIIEQLLGITKLSEKADILREESKTIKDSIKEEEFRISAATEANKKIEENIKALELKSEQWVASRDLKIKQTQDSILSLFYLDIESEISLHASHKEAAELRSEANALSREIASLDREIASLTRSKSALQLTITKSVNKICPTCNQSMDSSTHAKVHNDSTTQMRDIDAQLTDITEKRDNAKILLDSVMGVIPTLRDTYYRTLDEAYNHKSTLDKLGGILESELASRDPYKDQVESLRLNGLQEIDFSKLNELARIRDHQEFLLKLLTNKDSFIRKKIIDQNLSFLNHRLSHFLKEIGLPHSVKFKSDLEVEITLYGKEFDFDNLSRGERTRLILSLSWTFRDVYESMNDKINLMFIDELVDNGIDSAGTESVLKILKDMTRNSKKNIYLISHRDEFVGRVNNVLKVTKESGFTSISVGDVPE